MYWLSSLDPFQVKTSYVVKECIYNRLERVSSCRYWCPTPRTCEGRTKQQPRLSEWRTICITARLPPCSEQGDEVGAQISAKKLFAQKKSCASLLENREVEDLRQGMGYFFLCCASEREVRSPSSIMAPPWALVAPVALFLGFGLAADPRNFRQSSPEPTVGKGSHGFTSSLTVSWDTTADSTLPIILGQVEIQTICCTVAL